MSAQVPDSRAAAVDVDDVAAAAAAARSLSARALVGPDVPRRLGQYRESALRCLVCVRHITLVGAKTQRNVAMSG